MTTSAANLAAADDEAGASDEAPFRPHVAAGDRPPELSLTTVAVGSLLGIIFGASSLYLVLRVGMTVSASIPVAVLSITLFRVFARVFGTRQSTILENNIVQTAGSAGESIAFGVGVTVPALMILGYDLELSRVMLVAALGGLLGILMMIPLRRAFIVNQHGKLTYPEGTACAEVLIVGESGGASAKTVFVGFGLSFVYQVAMQALKIWQEYPSRALTGFKGAVVALEASPVLMGVGYIIGSRVASIILAGGMLSALVLTPAIALFGASATQPIFPAAKVIADMSPKEIRDAYVLYIGAGAVATGGVISLFQALPLIFASASAGLRDIRSTGKVRSERRTELDIPLWVVGAGSLALVVAIACSPLIPTSVPGRIVGALMVVLFGFLFVTVASRVTGEVGSSSSPISGMTVATLLLTCLIFVLLGWVGPEYRLAALSIAGIVCVAATNGGTTSQDLKTGFLVGATPRSQQIAILAGTFSSAIVIGGTLLLLNDASTVTTGNPKYLPTATVDVRSLAETAVHQGRTFHVWRLTNPVPGAQPGKYLVDDAGVPVYLVDPAINGRVDVRDDGTRVIKYDAPKATLMALIIDGIMTGRLPWGLVLIGVFIAVIVQLMGIPALAFAVGVYLPISTTAPIFVGGLIRSAVDRINRAPVGDSDASPAVLLSSGYIAGGAIAGILIALFAILPGASTLLDLSKALPASWNGSAWPALIAFGAMSLLLFLVGTGRLLGPDKADDAGAGSSTAE